MPSKATRARLERWRLVAAENDTVRFQERLKRDGIRDPQAVVGPFRLSGGHSLPGWIKTLEGLVAAGATRSRSRFQLLNPQDSKLLPFQEILDRFTAWADRRLAEQSDGGTSALSQTARGALAESLRQRLAKAMAPALFAEFSGFRGAGSPSQPNDPDKPPSRRRYRAFLRHLESGGLASFFREYSFLGRIVATLVDFWVEANSELLERLEADGPELESLFGDLGHVVDLQSALSDPHNRGRSVCGLTFASGLKLVYKPKNLAIEAAFNGLLDWSNEQGLSQPLRQFRVLSKAAHGWAEFIDHRECPDEAAVRRFFHRAGMMLGWTCALGGLDFTHENVLACGEDPVFIDLETLLQPRLVPYQPTISEEHSYRLDQVLSDSVISTLLLPEFVVGPDAQGVYDPSGLGLHDADQTFLMPTWVHPNTDAMALEPRPVRPRPRTNLPKLCGRQVPADVYVDQIASGFSEMYRSLLRHRDELLGPGGLVRRLATHQVRFVLRPTNDYAAVLRWLLYNPGALREGIDASIELEILNRNFPPAAPDRRRLEPLVKEEQRALLTLDIPFFHVRADGTEVLLPSGRVDAFLESSFGRTEGIFRRLGETDLRNQLFMLRGSFLAAQAHNSGNVSTPVQAAGTPPPPNLAGLVAEAARIAAKLSERAVHFGDERCTWIGLEHAPQLDRFRVSTLSAGLYNASGGIGLFLAALARATGDPNARALALAAV